MQRESRSVPGFTQPMTRKRYKRSQFAGLNGEHRYICPGMVRLHNKNSVCSVAVKDTVSGCCEDLLYTADTRAIQREPTVGPVNDQDAGIRGRMHSAWCFSWGNPHHSRFYFFQTKDPGYCEGPYGQAVSLVFAVHDEKRPGPGGLCTCLKNSPALVIFCDGFCVLLRQVPKGSDDDCYGTEDKPLLRTCSSYCKPCQQVERI